jgi:hypothetical protein
MCCHTSLSLITTCGLDRYVRIYNYEDNSLYHKIYMKQRMTAILFSKEEEGYQTASSLLKKRLIESPITSQGVVTEATIDDPKDDVWTTIEPVYDDHPKKKSKRR